jgi:hypothetical protein
MSYKWERPKSKREQFLDNLKEKPKRLHLVVAIIVSLVLVVIMYLYIFQPVEDYLRRLSSLGLMDLLFSWRSERIDYIFTAWQSEGIFREFIITIIDFPFIVCYCMALSGLILLVARRLHDKFQKVELHMVFIPILAGIFDIVENIFLLIMLGSNQAVVFWFPLITSICALIKVILIYTGIICFLAGIVGIILYHYEILEF